MNNQEHIFKSSGIDSIRVCTCCMLPCEPEAIDLSFDYSYGDGHYTRQESAILSDCCHAEYITETVDDYNDPDFKKNMLLYP